jgi:hypothetical protein
MVLNGEAKVEIRLPGLFLVQGIEIRILQECDEGRGGTMDGNSGVPKDVNDGSWAGIQE